jgi:hypothetical protein
MANTYTLISSNVLSGSAANVTFSSIPSTYTDLVLRMSVRTSSAGTSDVVAIQFNGDTGNNYSYTFLSGNGSSPTSASGSGFGTTYAGQTNGDGSTANCFGSVELYIPLYNSTTNKSTTGYGASEQNSTSAVMRAVSGYYVSSSGISSVTIFSNAGGNLLTGSSFYLYGIKNS